MWVYSQARRLQAEPHYCPISSPQAPQPPLPHLSPVQQLPLTEMPPGSAASIRPGGHVKGSKAVCQHTHAQKNLSEDFTLAALPSCLSHYWLSSSTRIHY